MTEQLRIWAGVQGFLSSAALLALLLFFALATPATGERRQWAWLGPTNDWLSVIGAVPWIVASVLLATRARAGTGVWVLTAASVVGIVALAAVTLLMLAGIVSLTGQAVVALLATALAFTWGAVVSAAAVTSGGLPRWVAVVALCMLIALVAGGILAGVAFAMPEGSVRLTFFVAAAICEGAAWLSFPAWWFMVASTAR